MEPQGPASGNSTHGHRWHGDVIEAQEDDDVSEQYLSDSGEEEEAEEGEEEEEDGGGGGGGEFDKYDAEAAAAGGGGDGEDDGRDTEAKEAEAAEAPAQTNRATTKLDGFGAKPRKRRNLVISDSDKQVLKDLLNGSAAIQDLEMKTSSSPSKRKKKTVEVVKKTATPAGARGAGVDSIRGGGIGGNYNATGSRESNGAGLSTPGKQGGEQSTAPERKKAGNEVDLSEDREEVNPLQLPAQIKEKLKPHQVRLGGQHCCDCSCLDCVSLKTRAAMPKWLFHSF